MNYKGQEFKHVPVLLQEVVKYLQPQPGKVVIDCTAGGGGHSRELLTHVLPGGKLIAFDQDMDAIEAAGNRLQALGKENYILIHSSFINLRSELKKIGVSSADCILFDLGVSSYQLDQGERGFSYQYDAPLDMRMDRRGATTAFDLVNNESEKELTRIIKDYGEERWAKRIAEFIIAERTNGPLETTGQLVDVIKKAIPHKVRREGPHPAKRTFQALRIAVNKELDILKDALIQAIDVLNPGGRLAVITFHSLEDRITKNVFQEKAQGCICPKDFPVCVCKRKPSVKILTTKPILPGEEELKSNPRSRSAKLRVVKKLA